MKGLFSSACLSVLLLVSCNQASHSDNAIKTDKDLTTNANEIQLEDEGLKSVLLNYFEVKDALVASDVSKTQESGTKLYNALIKIEGCESTAVIAQKVAAANSIDKQRKLFTQLTTDVIPVFKHTEIITGSVFIQFCPMANDDEGGYWLAKEDQINNPYYGNKMLKCGQVVEEFN